MLVAWAGISEGGKADFAGSLRNMCTLSDLKMGSLLDLIDEWARENGLDETAEPPHRPQPTRVEDSPRLVMDLTTRESKLSYGPPVTGPIFLGLNCLFSTARV